jgi:quercetin dioxygenase-like cupin family protein
MTVQPSFEVDVVVDGRASAGAYALLDVRAAAGAVVSRHVAAAEEVVVHLLDGRVELLVGREPRELRPGDHAVLPPGVPRAARVCERARLLLLFLPAGAERLALLLGDPPADADDLAALLTAAGISRLPG